MQIIVTMAGAGARFREAGYDLPKYQIRARGKTLFEWSMDSLLDYFAHASRCVFLARAGEDAAAFINAHFAAYGVERSTIIELDHLTDGQATTARIGVDACLPHEPIMIYNIDTYVEPYVLRYADISGDGYLPCFHAPGEHWSFARLNKAGRVAEVAEKRRISDNCSLGAYYFSSGALYREAYDALYGEAAPIKREKYVAPLYQYLIDSGRDVRISLVPHEAVHVLGTPAELQRFLEEPTC